MSERVVRVVLSGDASGLIRAAGQAATALGRVGNAGANSARGVANSSNSSARAVASSAQRMSGSARDASSSFQSMGGSASAGFGKIAAVAGTAVAAVGGLRLLTSAFKSTVTIGAEFQQNINQLGAEANVSGPALAAVSAKARALGNDLDLPAASASDAAQAMLELAKGNLTAQQAMEAAKGTLTLAAAAQISGADAATIQAAALNTFGLSADKAGHVADVLANTANAAAGEITDFAQGLAQSGSVAAGFGISIDDTATVLGLFAKNGIIGSDAGTSFKTMLTQLAAPTAQAKAAMDVLGLSVYDAGGKFVGTRALTDQLAKAQGRLTQEQFNLNATTVFGTDALRGANILAKEGDAGYTGLAKAVTKVGGAQTVAAAQTKGLTGAFGLVKNAVQDVQLNAFDKIAPSLETAVRGVATAIPGIANVVLPVFGHVVDQATQFMGQVGDVFKGFGPQNVSAVLQGAASIGTAVTNALQNAFTPEVLHIVGDFTSSVLKDLISLGTAITSAAGKFFTPIIAGAAQLIQTAKPYVEQFITIVKGTVNEIAPLGKTIGDLFKTLATNGTLDLVGNIITGIGSAAKGLASVLVPAVGGVARAFGAMGPVVDTAAVAVGGLLLLRGPLLGFFGSIQARAAAAAASLAASNGIAGAAGAAAGGLSRVADVLGGPWGLAIGAGVAALFTWISRSNKAADATRDFSDIVDKNTGKLTANAGAAIGQQFKQTIAAYVAVGGATGDYTLALEGNAAAQKRVSDVLTANETKAIAGSDAYKRNADLLASVGVSAADVTAAVNAGGDAFQVLQQKVTGNAGALKAAGTSATAVQQAFTGIASAVKPAADQYGQFTSDVQQRTTAVTDGTKAANEAAAATTKLGTAARAGSGGVKLMGTNTGDMSLAAESAQIQLSLTGKAVSYMGDAALAAQRNAADTAKAMQSIGAVGPDAATQSTAVADALKKFADNASVADQNAQFFLLSMQRIGGKDISAQQALDAQGASVRAIGAAYRDVTQNLIDQRKAAADLKTAQDNLNKTEVVKKTDTNGNEYDVTQRASDATTQDDITAANLRLQASNAAVAGSQAAVNDAQAKAQSTTSTLVSSILQQEVATKGISIATKDAKKALADQRQAFIDQIATQGGSIKATAATTAEANKLADAYGLIPKTVDTVISNDPTLFALGAKQVAADKAAIAKAVTVKFNAATKDALGDIGLYGQTISRFPKSVKSKFDADVAVAHAAGKELYRVYNKTTGKWEATFETPGAAASQVKAHDLVQQYDKAKGTWTANLVAVDDATAKIKALTTLLGSIGNYQVQLDIATAVNKLPTSLQASGAALAEGFAANGGHAATGGKIRGPGTGTSDSIPMWLSDGEFVVKAAQTAKYGSLLESINTGAMDKYAAGGLVRDRLNVHQTSSGTGGQDAAAGVQAFYAQAAAEGAASNKAAAAAAKAAAVAAAAIPKANSGGTEQWRALATKVAQAHGENLASVQVMLNQMSRESGGNPAAINLTDSNAQAGHPSVGLLQFIPGTFAANADPGFSSNIYDPESQMRAWYNYINRNYGGYVKFGQRGYGAYAQGGLINGRGTGTSDSNLAMVSNGEFIVNQMATSKYLPLLQNINKYAAGGYVGSESVGLSGRSYAQAGSAQAAFVAALQNIVQVVQALRATTTDKIGERNAAGDALRAAKRDSSSNKKSAQETFNDSQNQRRIALKAAQDRVDAAKTAATRKTASNALAKLEAQQAITSAAADRALAKVKATSKANVESAQKAYDAAYRTANAYKAAASAAEKYQKAQQAQYRAQQARAARVDVLNGQLSTAQDKLSGLRSDRASLASGISGNVSGFDGGLTGHNDTRTSFATILKGQQYDLAQVAKFNLNITKLRNLGLSKANLNEIASAGVDGGGATAAGLVGSSKVQINKLNQVTAQIQSQAGNVGSVVAGQFYDAGICAGQGLVNGLKSQIGEIQKVMNSVAASVISTLTHKLQIHSPSQVLHDLGGHTAQGFANGIAGSTPAVIKAIDNMAAIPNMAAIRPTQTGGSSSTGQQNIDVQVYLDGTRIDDRIDVKVNGSMIELGHAFEKAGMQS